MVELQIPIERTNERTDDEDIQDIIGNQHPFTCTY